MVKRTAVRNGLVANELETTASDLLVEDGKIAGILSRGQVIPKVDEQIDASGLIVVPGGVDSHVHFWEPWDSDVEGFYRGTCSAAAGGISAVLEMPQAAPTVTYPESFQQKLRLAKNESVVDFGLYGGVVPNNLGKVRELYSQGAIAFKAFMTSARATFPHLNDSQLLSALRSIRDVDSVLVIHAESHELLQSIEADLRARGRKGPDVLREWRPPKIEVEAIRRVLLYAQELGAHAHIAHVSAMEGADLIAKSKSRGLRITAETCPQYLLLDDNLVDNLGPYLKCLPPVRSVENQRRLWDFVGAGVIDSIVSDHAPYSFEAKERGWDDIWQAGNGLNCIQVMNPLLFSEIVHKRRMGIQRFVQLTSTGAARIFGLYPGKGTIAIGSDADLVFYDPSREWTVDTNELHSKYKWTPFSGLLCRGRVVTTMVRGEVVCRENEILVQRGYGRWIPGQGARSLSPEEPASSSRA